LEDASCTAAPSSDGAAVVSADWDGTDFDGTDFDGEISALGVPEPRADETLAGGASAAGGFHAFWALSRSWPNSPPCEFIAADTDAGLESSRVFQLFGLSN
jgi:hypothetical protein